MSSLPVLIISFIIRCIALKRFVEKPAQVEAEHMLAAGNYLWNAGIFLFTAKSIIAAYRAHALTTYQCVKAALD